ncbi:MAG TPA: oligosaccharide flippase family protein [Mycobacteriales bacterium]
MTAETLSASPPPPRPAGNAAAGTAAGTAPRDRRAGSMPDLFGRGMLYVVVWSLQLVSASLVSAVLAHLLGPAEFGLLATAIAVHQVLVVFATVGLDQAIVLERVRDEGSRAARGLLGVGLVAASLVMAVAAATSPWWGRWLGFGGATSLVVAVVLWTAPGAGVQLTMALLRSEDRLGPFALLSCLSAIGGQAVGLTLLVAGTRDAGTYAWGGAVSFYAALAAGIVLTRPRPAGLVAGEVLSRALRLGLPLVLGNLSVFVLNAGDRIVVQRFLGAAEAGRYQVAYTVGNVVLLLLVFTSQAWTPRIAAVDDVGERWLLAARSRDELYRILVPVLLGVTLAAPVLLRVVAPASFRPAGLLAVVFLVAVASVPLAAVGASGRALVSVRRSHPLAVAAVLAAAANVGLNLLLVPAVGLVGAAVATVAAFALQAVLQRMALPARPRWPASGPAVLAAVTAAVAVAGLSVLLPQTGGWNAARFLVALACLPWFLSRLRDARSGRAGPAGRHRRPRARARSDGPSSAARQSGSPVKRPRRPVPG